MGTSTPSPGQEPGTPLVPSWLDDLDAVQPTPDTPPEEAELVVLEPLAEPLRPPVETSPLADRFRAPRTNFTNYLTSGNRGALRRAASGYVKRASGGSRRATQRMGAARATGGRLLGVLRDVQRQGVDTTLRQLNLTELIGRPVVDVLVGLIDFVCPSGGRQDEAIARDAAFDALDRFLEQHPDIDTVEGANLGVLLEEFLTCSVEERLLNDIGTQVIALPDDVQAVNDAEAEVQSLIRGAVQDAVFADIADIEAVGSDELTAVIDTVYEAAFDYLANLREDS